MMVSAKGSLMNLVRWQQDKIWVYAASATAVFVLNFFHWLEWIPRFFAMPTTPIAVVGGAIGIFVSFRTNAAYDRWWEGRKLWGRLINTSRHFGTQALNFIGPRDRDLAEALVRRHIAYVHTLRCLLRVENPFVDVDVQGFLQEDELATLPSKSNTTHAILHIQHAEFTTFADSHDFDPRKLQQLDESVRHLLDIQGGCERIKKTPFPPGYGFIAEQLILLYSIILPFSIVDDLGIFVIPLNVLVCTAFTLISEVGRVLEDPFTNFYNGLPLMAMSKTIENDLRSRMGEENLTPVPGVDAKGILM